MIKEFLESVNIFYSLKDQDLEGIASLCKIKNYPKTSKIKCAKYVVDSIYRQIIIKWVIQI